MWYNLAGTYSEQEQIALLETGLTLGPTNEEESAIHLKLGKLRSGLGWMQKAIDHVCRNLLRFVTHQYLASNRLAPSSDTFYVLGLAYMKIQSWTDAVAAMKQVKSCI